MRRLPRIALLVALVAIAPVIAGCSDFDPDSLDVFGLSNKKPLPGKRELLFPNGVPGVTQGIPPEYQEGYKQPAISDLPPGDSDATPSQTATGAPTKPVQESNLGKPAQARQATAKPKSKPKHRVVKRKPKPKPKATATATEPKGATAPWPSTPQPSTAQPTGTQAPWPSTSQSQPAQSQSSQSQSTKSGWPSGEASQDQKLAPWPSAPPSGTFSKQ